MNDALRATSLDQLDLSVRAFEWLQRRGARTVADVLAWPELELPRDWPVKQARLVAKELLELFAELGVSYEGVLIMPPAGVATLQASGSVTERWARIEAWLEARWPRALRGFRAAATPAAIAAAEAALGVSLPEDYKQFLQLHDGQEPFEPWVGLGALLPIAEVVKARAGLVHAIAGNGAAQADAGVRAVDCSPGWIPIARSERGRDYLCLDLDPAPDGVRGQIVEYVVDDWRRRRVAGSFAELLSLYFEQAQTGELDFEAEEAEQAPGTVR